MWAAVFFWFRDLWKTWFHNFGLATILLMGFFDMKHFFHGKWAKILSTRSFSVEHYVSIFYFTFWMPLLLVVNGLLLTFLIKWIKTIFINFIYLNLFFPWLKLPLHWTLVYEIPLFLVILNLDFVVFLAWILFLGFKLQTWPRISLLLPFIKNRLSFWAPVDSGVKDFIDELRIVLYLDIGENNESHKKESNGGQTINFWEDILQLDIAPAVYFLVRAYSHMEVHKHVLVSEVHIFSIWVESSKIPGCLIRHKPSYIWDKVNSFDIEGVTLEVIHTKDTKVSADMLFIGLIKVFKINIHIFVINSVISTF